MVLETEAGIISGPNRWWNTDPALTTNPAFMEQGVMAEPTLFDEIAFVNPSKKCRRCGRVLPATDFYPYWNRSSGLTSMCKQCERAKSADYARTHPEKTKQAQQKYKSLNRDEICRRQRLAYAADPQKRMQQAKAYREKNRESIRVITNRANKAFRKRIRIEMLAAYGGRCACCGEDEPLFIHLDHIFGGGREEIRAVGGTLPLLVRLKSLGWPKDKHQLLCANCNHGKAMNGGICPHKSKQQNVES